MYKMCFEVRFTTETGLKYRLDAVHSVDITKSVENLANTCLISLPGSRYNEPLFLSKEIKRGTQVSVYLGYSDNLTEEFRGYIREILTNDGLITIECEDALFLFRKTVANKQYTSISIKELVEDLCKQVDQEYTVACDYNVTYEKFTVNDATAYDVLKKIQEETAANIWFDTISKTLHIHAAYLYKSGEVIYSMQRNIESSSLEYRTAMDKKFEVVIETTDKNGKVFQLSTGTTGGERITKKVGNVSQADAKVIADNVLTQHLFDGYKGSFTSWLIPYVEPTYTCEIRDFEYPEKTGKYYVVSVNTSFSDKGGVRTIEPGIKLSV